MNQIHAGVLRLIITACLGMFRVIPASVVMADEPISIEPKLVHLRSGEVREWSEFPLKAEGSDLVRPFQAARHGTEVTLRLRHADVKQVWRVSVNEKRLGELHRDENDMLDYFAVPAGTLREGRNELQIEPASRSAPNSDDIRVGEIVLDMRPKHDVLNEARVEINVVDADSLTPLPCRLTVLENHWPMQVVGATSNEELAVRPGTVYAAQGRASFGLPAGKFQVYAGRGFEYSLAKEFIELKPGESVKRTMKIRREVPTPGYVACDPHVHTLTHSGHGDASEIERLITLAGEGIELPIATDHNKHIDLLPTARALKLTPYLTPVIGNEVTTSVGHFNIFPIEAGAQVVDHKQTQWGGLFDSIYATPGVRVAILNHARDLHSGVRPFGPQMHISIVGENLDDWPMRFNAMEVVNSGATQSEPFRLFHDWMGLLNRGLQVTPVGSSDSHDVLRHFVGQGRTYIRCDDRDAGKIDVSAAVANFVKGKVLVSYGLLAELTVNEVAQSGDVAKIDGNEIRAVGRVLGPHWVRPFRVFLFANGNLIRQEVIPKDSAKTFGPGVKWEGSWTLPKPHHDQHLVLIAVGWGVDEAFWRTAKPYQPTSPTWISRVIGCSGAVWVDADGDGRAMSARDYAIPLVAKAKLNGATLIQSLAPYDEAVAAHATYLFHHKGGNIRDAAWEAALEVAPKAVQSGVSDYLEAARESGRMRAM